MLRLFFIDIDELVYVSTNGALAVFIEGRGEPDCASVGQRTKTGIEMIKTRIDQLDGNDKASKQVGDGTVGLDIATKFVTAKESISTEERIAFSLEIQLLGQPQNFISPRFHPAGEMRCFASPFLVAKIARDKLPANREPGVCRKNHVGQFRLGRDQFDFRADRDERFM